MEITIECHWDVTFACRTSLTFCSDTIKLVKFEQHIQKSLLRKVCQIARAWQCWPHTHMKFLLLLTRYNESSFWDALSALLGLMLRNLDIIQISHTWKSHLRDPSLWAVQNFADFPQEWATKTRACAAPRLLEMEDSSSLRLGWILAIFWQQVKGEKGRKWGWSNVWLLLRSLKSPNL